jgi:anti-sigma B factor antagonist
VANADAATVSFARRDDGTAVAALAGELDQSCAAPIKEQLLAAIEPGATLVVDLAALEFMDSSGLAVLV